MKYIDLDNWPRKRHFNFFKQMDYPHFSLCANVDLTKIYPFIKENNLSFFKTILYIAVRTANNIKEFRYRIRGEKIIEHEIIHPAFTVLREDEVFSFCRADYKEDFIEFCKEVAKKMDMVKKNLCLEDEPGKDNHLIITSIPWISFTSLSHPINLDPTDSIPRIAWGKYFKENGKLKIPLSVQVHHALMDGLHVGKYFSAFQNLLNHPEKIIE
ncbi:chloramphenicol acetyltransferase [Anoxybacter fermentans]|uniref:Chloramphenicol acetyltransferase n=1 Tax=Anoxybacter fermentans TaxID=1323375 RepID=A0A3S9T1K3_9FIRM|nr:chloramphenicol acetyltransferase [Anoxybacter fermentans]AZR74387.1 chloramphenicol acetyltransferase [Anoxybacter fermentans]